jgi:tetratricopeptide (TPR) repeat protein
MNYLKNILVITFFILLTGCSKTIHENKIFEIDKVKNDKQNRINIKLVKEADVAIEEKNYIKANLLYSKACINNNAKACFKIAVSYDNGNGVLENKSKASKLYEKSCRSNYLWACKYLGNIEYHKKNYSKANKLYSKACNGNNVSACSTLANLYEKGLGVKQDNVQAITLYSKACEGNNNYACNHLGTIYGNGLIVKRSYKTAKKYFKLSCNLGNTEGCDNYNKLIKITKKEKKLVLVKENHAVLKYDNIEYILDTYIVMFENPYYIKIERTDKKEISKEKAIDISLEYIKPRGCTSTIKRLPKLDKKNTNKTKWLIGISC